MVKKGQSQRQTQIVNVNVKGDKKAKRRKGKKVNRKEGKPETRIIPAFNPPPIINYPPAFNQQFNPNQWLSPPAPAPKIAPKVLVEGETAETLGVPAYTPVDLTLESRFRTAEPAPNIAERAVAERAVEPFPPAEFVPSSSPLVEPEPLVEPPPELLPPELLPPPPTELLPTELFPPPPPTEQLTSPARLAPGETLPPITPASGDEPRRRGRPRGSKNKQPAVGTVLVPVLGERIAPPEAGIPLGQLSPSEFTAIPPLSPPRRTYVLGGKEPPVFPTRAVSDPGLREGEGYFSPGSSPQPISFLGEEFQAEPQKNPLERQRQEGFSGSRTMGGTVAPSELSLIFNEV